MSARITIPLLAALLVAGCAKAPDIDPKTGKPLLKLILQTDWYAQAEHGGYYQAMVKGYYREVGLDVEIDPGGPEAPIGLLLATDKVQFMICRGDDSIAWISREIPIVIVGAHMEHDVQAILLHDESPVHTFADLNGKSVMTVPGSTWITYLQQRHITFNITPDNLGMARFMADPTFIQQCFLTNEPYYAEVHGEKARVMTFAEAGYDFYRVVLGNADWVKRHPEATRAFMQASNRGWAEYLNGDRREADKVILTENRELKQDYLDYAVAAMRKYKLVEGFPEKGESIGALSRSRLQQQIDILKSCGALAEPITVDDIADFQFTKAN
jgi:NitT/TauT family transport system substrate-binding protein